MTDAAVLQQTFERFAAEFLLPLVGGGSARVGRPLAPGALGSFAHARPADAEVDQDLFDRLHATASELAPVEALPYPDHGTMATAMACHDLLAVTDPALDRAWARRARPVVLGWVDALVGAIEPPASRGAALSRHAVLARALGLRRRDVIVRNWAYTYRFFGRPVPPRVVAMPKLRRVKREEHTRDVLALWTELDVESDLAVRPRLRALLSRSPVTELLHPELAPDLRLGAATLSVLGDAGVRYGVASQLADEGLDLVGAPLGHALRSLVACGPEPEELARALLLVWEVHVTTVLGERDPAAHPRPASPDAEIAFAVLPALLEPPPGLSPRLALSPRDRERVALRGRELQQRLAPETVRWVRSLVAQADGGERAAAGYVEAAS